ncbi:MAG: toll/interleukin-1 receptor domain-containing protein, partial [Eubacterium sp.]|nr:toll/interleukin-1 receptor domain-containing protein [Eubacterium sp.]
MDIPSAYLGNEPYIFLSYSHADNEAALEVISALNENGYRVWYDDGITPGAEWDANIAEHIKDCSFFISLISKNYLSSSNCRDELNFV